MSLLGSMPSSVDRTSKQQTNIPPTFTDDAATLHPGVDNPDNNQEGIQQLARTLSRRSFASASQAGQSAVLGDPLHPEADSPFDPFGEQFDSAAWVKAVFALHTSNPNAPPLRSSGVAFENLLVHGFGSESDYQATVGNMPLKVIGAIKSMLSNKQRKIQILNGLDGVLDSGEMLVVLGPPGSGCSTFLKTLANETHGFYVSDESKINYKGVTPKQMRKNFAGEAIYSAETEQHFPTLTVQQTLEFAAEARCPRNPPGGLSQREWSSMLAAVVMAVFGISHTRDTKVGSDYIRGVSGGERKRVSIAEVALSNAPLSLWDNSTRGLDSATAISFCRSIKSSVSLTGSAAAVAIYQAPQPAYEVFDKVIVLYDGEQIYFGPTKDAKAFFVDMGFYCPDQQTTPDFLTGLTSPAERRKRDDFKGTVPSTPEEFSRAWKASETYRRLKAEIKEYEQKYPTDGEMLETFKASRRAQQSKHSRHGSPYTLSYAGQVKLCLRRGFQRLRSNPEITLSQLGGNFIMALIISSVFYNLPVTTATFYSRGSLLFFAILLNAFGSALEILTLYAQRPIIDKQTRYAFCHASAESVASIICDLPYKILNAITFNLTLYFMTNLRRSPGNFFFFMLVSFILTLAMSGVFRSIAALSKSLSQALVPAAILILILVLYTGFALPVPYQLGWISWIRYLNPIQYGFESLMVNEFYDRAFACAQTVPAGPGYPGVDTNNVVCSVPGSVAGQNYVQGTDYILLTYGYQHANKWRNVGIIIAFAIGLTAIYIAASEYISESKSKGEVVVFPRTRVPKALKDKKSKNDSTHSSDDVESSAGAPSRAAVEDRPSSPESASIPASSADFSFENLCYEIPVKGGTRMLLDHVDGWVKPGTLTCLMGVSGAGKTTLLDCLASRVTMGVITGDILVAGEQRDDSFQRSTGYVQQQDLHLETATCREALTFSALLRQPRSVPKEEKLAYVEEIIKLLEMDSYADAVVGKTGEGLNVEQRKRLSIGVEMVAKPELLLFLDEPSSGLDSQTSWSILNLLETLKNHGQAVLCTIHQPSAMLFSRFDRLLFLARGGRTIYFGEVGSESKILRAYFERNGAFECPSDANPAEWMLEVIGAAPGSHTDIDWHETWKSSEEFKAVKEELRRLKSDPRPMDRRADADSYAEFAAPFASQLRIVTVRVAQQYWRSPVYLYSKTALCILVPLFIGFSFFNADTSQQGLQNQLFSVFLLFTIFGQLVQQIMPQFVKQRDSYEVRERPSRTYSWPVFMLSNILIELPWNTLMAVLMFFCLYYPIGLASNAVPTDSVTERGALFFLLVWSFLMFTSTFSHMIIAFNESAETGGNMANLLFSLSLIFCGVLVTSDTAPGFWVFMFYLSPFKYLAEGLLATALGGTTVVCSASELLQFTPTNGQTCEAYMAPYISAAGGRLANPQSQGTCQFCPLEFTNTFLESFDYHFENRWRDFGIIWIYILFNIVAALFLYWLARVPKKAKKEKKTSKNGKGDENKAGSSSEKKQ